MEKFLKFALLGCTLFFALTPSFAVTEVFPLENKTTEITLCDAPAPDSFRLTSRGPNFIALAWHPISPLSTHTLIVLTRVTASGIWVPLDTFYNVPGANFTVTGVASDVYCQLILATNCPSGEVSARTSIIFLDKIIVELVVGARSPKNPTVVNCENIDYTNHEWFGFRVSYNLEGFVQSNIYEMAVVMPTRENGLSVQRYRIKRLVIGHPVAEYPLYAVNESDEWPILPSDLIQTKNPFKMIHVFEDINHLMGQIEITTHLTSPPTIDLCEINWNYGEYIFEPLVASALGGSPLLPPVIDERSTNHTSTQILAQNPFNETLNIFFPNSTELAENVNVLLLNMSGQVVLNQKYLTMGNYLTIPAGFAPPGIYLLRIKTENTVHILKVFKN